MVSARSLYAVDVVLGATGEDQSDRTAVGDFGCGRHPFGGVTDH